MTSSNIVQLPQQRQPELPEITNITANDFDLAGDKVIVRLPTRAGEPVRFATGLDKFLAMMTAAVMFINPNSAIFDYIGAP